MIENISLNFYNENGDCIEYELEPFQVKALIEILGLKISVGEDGAFKINGYGPKTIENIIQKGIVK